MEQLFIAGNHLANYLIGQNCMPDEYKSHEEVRAKFNYDVMDVWIGWKAIMDLRNGTKTT